MTRYKVECKSCAKQWYFDTFTDATEQVNYHHAQTGHDALSLTGDL